MYFYWYIWIDIKFDDDFVQIETFCPIVRTVVSLIRVYTCQHLKVSSSYALRQWPYSKFNSFWWCCLIIRHNGISLLFNVRSFRTCDPSMIATILFIQTDKPNKYINWYLSHDIAHTRTIGTSAFATTTDTSWLCVRQS